MSKGIRIAEAMVGHINASPGFDGVEAIVDRQLDISTEIEKRLGLALGKSKGKGAVITVFYSGFENPDASGSNAPNVIRNYLVSIYAAPTMSTGNTPADLLMENTAIVLHAWEAAEFEDISQIHVTGGEARPDDDYLIYDLTVKIHSRLKPQN